MLHLTLNLVNNTQHTNNNYVHDINYKHHPSYDPCISIYAVYIIK